MKKRKFLIMSLMIALFAVVIPTVVFAEYYYDKKIRDASVGLGDMTIDSSIYLSYAKKNGDKYTTERLETPEEYPTSGRMTCYASEKTGYTGEDQYMSLNQLGFEFSYTNSIDVYVRVQVLDTWISRKYYSGSQEAKDTYISRDNSTRYVATTDVNETNYSNYFTISATKATSYTSGNTYYTYDSTSKIYTENANVSSKTSFTENNYYILTVTKATSYSTSTTYYYNSSSPFDVQNENWVYDARSGYIYYKLVSEASSEAHTVSFEINENYTYVSNNDVFGYREAILVEVGFNVDIVQANRAKAKWGIDMKTYFD